jgi:hypothetical protein
MANIMSDSVNHFLTHVEMMRSLLLNPRNILGVILTNVGIFYFNNKKVVSIPYLQAIIDVLFHVMIIAELREIVMKILQTRNMMTTFIFIMVMLLIISSVGITKAFVAIL